jgi:hypothetical protein
MEWWMAPLAWWGGMIPAAWFAGKSQKAQRAKGKAHTDMAMAVFVIGWPIMFMAAPVWLAAAMAQAGKKGPPDGDRKR